MGHDPATQIFADQIERDEEGYVKTRPGTSYTNIEGVFAAGDVQDKRYRQAITSAGSGCIAALEAEKWLAEREDDGEKAAMVNGGTEERAEKGEGEAGKEVPEYRENPLL